MAEDSTKTVDSEEESSEPTKTSYEIMFILRADLSDKDTETELQEVRDLITSNGGNVNQEDLWGLQDLAYRIKKQDRGYYGVFTFELDSSKIKEFESPMNINQNVIRYLVTKTPSGYKLRTLAEYREAAEKEAHRVAEEKAKKARKPAKKAEKPAEKKKQEPKKEESKEKLEEVDKKLKSIIDDPDITI